jgi:hypothetical protein
LILGKQKPGPKAPFRAALVDDCIRGRTNALFLTGLPGAGKKTTALPANIDQFPPDARIVYEGQLWEVRIGAAKSV